jgi:hypothetical protein
MASMRRRLIKYIVRKGKGKETGTRAKEQKKLPTFRKTILSQAGRS